MGSEHCGQPEISEDICGYSCVKWTSKHKSVCMIQHWLVTAVVSKYVKKYIVKWEHFKQQESNTIIAIYTRNFKLRNEHL